MSVDFPPAPTVVEVMTEIAVPGHGFAKRLNPRGMSDYPRLDPCGVWVTADGCRVYRHLDGWQVQFKGRTSARKPTLAEALKAFGERNDAPTPFR